MKIIKLGDFHKKGDLQLDVMIWPLAGEFPSRSQIMTFCCNKMPAAGWGKHSLASSKSLEAQGSREGIATGMWGGESLRMDWIGAVCSSRWEHWSTRGWGWEREHMHGEVNSPYPTQCQGHLPRQFPGAPTPWHPSSHTWRSKQPLL